MDSLDDAEHPNDCWPGDAVVVVAAPDPPLLLEPLGLHPQVDGSTAGHAGAFTEFVTW